MNEQQICKEALADAHEDIARSLDALKTHVEDGLYLSPRWETRLAPTAMHLARMMKMLANCIEACQLATPTEDEYREALASSGIHALRAWLSVPKS